jgi:hypothetical protein
MPCYTRVKVTVELEGSMNVDRLSRTLQDLGFSMRVFGESKHFTKYGMEIKIGKDGKITASGYDENALECAKTEIKRAYTRTTVLENAKRYGFSVKEKTGQLEMYKP